MNNSTQKIINIILAVIVSVGAWIFVVYNYYPMTDVRYSEVPLGFDGEEELADRGLAVSDASVESISVTLNQKRIDVNKYSASDISALLNVSNCVAGDNKVSLNVTGPKETTVVSYDNEAIDVKVDRTDSTYMDIDVIYGEGAAEDAVPIASDLSRGEAMVTCAAGRLSDVKRVAAVLDPDEVGENTKSFTATLVALDKNGNIVPHTVIYPDEISLDASAGKRKTVALKVNVKNKAAEDYERKFSAPDKVTIKGAKDVMDKISSVDTEEIDISYTYENGELPIYCILPEGAYLADDPDKLVLKYTVNKKATEETEKEAGKEED